MPEPKSPQLELPQLKNLARSARVTEVAAAEAASAEALGHKYAQVAQVDAFGSAASGAVAAGVLGRKCVVS